MAKIHRYLSETDQITMVPTLVTETATSPATSSINDEYISQANFDTNMVIVLAALLCTLICALGLNSIVRCVLRCSSGRLSADTSEGATARLAVSGLKKRELRQIPVAAYGSFGVNISATECAICLGDFVDGENVRVLPQCKHEFHVNCIDTWLMSHSSCPNCRHSLLGCKADDTELSPPGQSLGRAAVVGVDESGHRGSVVIVVEDGR